MSWPPLTHRQLTALATGTVRHGATRCTVQAAAQACATALGGDWQHYAHQLLTGEAITTGCSTYQQVAP